MKFPAIREHHLYNKAYRSGKRFFGRYVCVYVLKDTHAKLLRHRHPQKIFVNRLGLSVSKKLGGAVVRSRCRRIMREGLRAVEKKGDLKKGFLIVIAARSSAISKTSCDIERDLDFAFKKLGMYQ